MAERKEGVFIRGVGEDSCRWESVNIERSHVESDDWVENVRGSIARL